MKPLSTRWLLTVGGMLLLTGCGINAAPGSSTAPPAEPYTQLVNALPLATPPPANGPFAGPTDSSQPAVVKRVIIKNAQLDISAADPSLTLDKILAFADVYGGWVVNSNTAQRAGSNGDQQISATVEIRVPAEKLDTVVAQIKALAVAVNTFHITGEDVTDQYVDLSSQLTNLQATEAQLKKIMDGAANTTDVLSVYRELTMVRGQIEQIQGKLNFYNQSAAYSSISVNITPVVSDVSPINISSWQPGNTINNAISALVAFVKFAIDLLIWLVILGIPVVIVLGMVILVIRRLQKLYAALVPHTPDIPALETIQGDGKD